MALSKTVDCRAARCLPGAVCCCYRVAFICNDVSEMRVKAVVTNAIAITSKSL